MDKVSGNPSKNRIDGHMALIIVTALFVTLYLVSNVMAVKVISVFGLLCFDAGTITFPFSYMLGDILAEIWGFKTARKVVWITFLCNVIMVICTQIGVLLPPLNTLDVTAQAYNQVFNYVPRIVLASLVAFLCGGIVNAWSLEKIKKITNGKKLWIRTIGSSAVGYLFDAVPFVLIAFAGTIGTAELISMIVIQYFSKLLIEALFGTPMAYAGIAFIKSKVDLAK